MSCVVILKGKRTFQLTMTRTVLRLIQCSLTLCKVFLFTFHGCCNNNDTKWWHLYKMCSIIKWICNVTWILSDSSSTWILDRHLQTARQKTWKVENSKKTTLNCSKTEHFMTLYHMRICLHPMGLWWNSRQGARSFELWFSVCWRVK
jgi:hypothetical protein